MAETEFSDNLLHELGAQVDVLLEKAISVEPAKYNMNLILKFLKTHLKNLHLNAVLDLPSPEKEIFSQIRRIVSAGYLIDSENQPPAADIYKIFRMIRSKHSKLKVEHQTESHTNFNLCFEYSSSQSPLCSRPWQTDLLDAHSVRTQTDVEACVNPDKGIQCSSDEGEDEYVGETHQESQNALPKTVSGSRSPGYDLYMMELDNIFYHGEVEVYASSQDQVNSQFYKGLEYLGIPPGWVYISNPSESEQILEI